MGLGGGSIFRETNPYINDIYIKYENDLSIIIYTPFIWKKTPQNKTEEKNIFMSLETLS